MIRGLLPEFLRPDVDTQEYAKGEQQESPRGTCEIIGFHFIFQVTWRSPWLKHLGVQNLAPFYILDQSCASSNLANADPATQFISLVDLFTG